MRRMRRKTIFVKSRKGYNRKDIMIRIGSRKGQFYQISIVSLIQKSTFGNKDLDSTGSKRRTRILGSSIFPL